MLEHRFTFRLANANREDGEQFCELFNSLYRRHVNYNYYLWQFFNTPFSTNLSMALTQEGQLAGSYGFHIIDSIEKGQPMAWALDIMIDPQFQGKRLFRDLALFAEKQVSKYKPIALCVMANEHGDAVHVYGLKWHRVNILESYTCDTTPYSKCKSIDIEFISLNNLELVEEFKIHSFLQSSLNRFKPLFSRRRTIDYLKWRYINNPWHQYHPIGVFEKGKPVGYLILKIFRDPDNGQSFGDIVDMVWLSNDTLLLTEMVRFAIGHFYAQGISHAVIWLQTNTLLDQVGRDLGFIEMGQKHYFCCKVLTQRYRWLEDPKRWFITMSDSEIY